MPVIEDITEVKLLEIYKDGSRQIISNKTQPHIQPTEMVKNELQNYVVEHQENIPYKWNEVLEQAWNNHKNGYDREKFYRLYGDSFWTPEDEEQYQQQVQAQTIDKKSGNYTIPILANVPIAQHQPTFADKKEEFEKRYPILTRSQIENWIKTNLPDFAIAVLKIIDKHFGGDEQQFCKYCSHHLIPSFNERNGFSSRIAMIKIKSKEKFCFV